MGGGSLPEQIAGALNTCIQINQHSVSATKRYTTRCSR